MPDATKGFDPVPDLLVVHSRPDRHAGATTTLRRGCWLAALPPATAQRAVDLDHGEAFLQAELRQRELAGEEVALRVEYL